jgi:RimJ/RimL family protein N-acetyltransferase
MSGPPTTPVPLPFGRYLLDAVRTSDVDAVAAALVEPDVALWNPGASRPASSARERAEIWVGQRATWAADHASWAVRDVDGALVGQVSIHQIDTVLRSAEIGYWLAPAGRGRGLGTAAVATTTRYGFKVLGLVRIELFHAVDNGPSCRLATRCGYVLEGTTRQSFVYGDGRRHDEHLHARLASDPAPELPLAR